MSDDHTTEAYAQLGRMVATLLGPNGCPWDRKQTPASMCDYLVEETFELVEAIRANDAAGAREELGDVLFLITLMGTLLERDSEVSAADAMRDAAEKMRRRHPHVFADTQVESIDEINANWEAEKRKEKGAGTSTMDSLPRGLPPLLKAYRINAKAAGAGFTWPGDGTPKAHEPVAHKLAEEWEELQAAIASGDAHAVQEEFGDYLFTLAEYGRRLGLKANAALDFANHKFLTRFARLEQLARERGAQLSDMDDATLDALWQQAKRTT